MQRKLGSTKLLVNPIGFGGIPIQRLSIADSDKIIEKAIQSGINFFDSSRIYTDSEEKLGRILNQHRSKVIIATKSFARNRDLILRDIEVSLKKLKTDFIDLYQCHNVSSEDILKKCLDNNGAVEGLIRAKELGMIKSIGITGHKPWILKLAIERFDFDTIQIPVNYIETSALSELIPLANKKNIGVIAMKPVAGGALKQVALNLRFILTNGVDLAIPGMDEPHQVTDNLSVLQNLEPLNEAEVKLLEEEKERLGESFCRRCEYCMPCPEGLNISFLHLLGSYYFNYDLKEWAWERLQALQKTYSSCIKCGQCIQKCPYELNTPELFEKLDRRIREDYTSLKGEQHE
jgi:predicted aldo/keto reductase-like oxidoreductase